MLVMHYENMRELYPDDDVMVLFDLDGTIVNIRSMMLYALKSFDRAYKTEFFKDLQAESLDVQDTDIDNMLTRLRIPHNIGRKVTSWYNRHLWSQDALCFSHRPYANIMGIIRCLQIQPRTHVGLCTGSAGRFGDEIHTMLNHLGKDYNVAFTPDMIFVDSDEGDRGPSYRLTRACCHFQSRGFRLVAVVDSEPENHLSDMSYVDGNSEILFLHADTVEELMRLDVPLRALYKNTFNIADLVCDSRCAHHA